MLIDCPACAASYHVSRSEIGDDGRTVICPRCDAQWFVRTGDADLAPAPTDLRTPAFSSRPARTALAGTASRAAPRPFWRALVPGATVAAALLLAMTAIGGRERIVRAAPRAAVFYAAMGLPVNVRGLEIADLVPTRLATTPDEMTVTGAIRNVVHRRLPVPRLSYEVRDAAGTLLMSWTEHPPAKTLATGRTLPFVSSPHAIPAEGRSIIVRFAAPDETTDPIHLAGRAD